MIALLLAAPATSEAHSLPFWSFETPEPLWERRLETLHIFLPALLTAAPVSKGMLFVDSPTPTLLCLGAYLVLVSVWYSILARKPAQKEKVRLLA